MAFKVPKAQGNLFVYNYMKMLLKFVEILFVKLLVPFNQKHSKKFFLQIAIKIIYLIFMIGNIRIVKSTENLNLKHSKIH